jgi:asparagine synthetase B (glutamine-hydrolysing)
MQKIIFIMLVVKRLMADVEVGVFLSGGLDSSLIAAMAKKHLPILHSFSVGVDSVEAIISFIQFRQRILRIHSSNIFMSS